MTVDDESTADPTGPPDELLTPEPTENLAEPIAAADELPPDLALEVLERIRAGRGLRTRTARAGPPGVGTRGTRTRRSGPQPGDRDQWSGAGPGPLDPAPVGSLFAGLLAERGWDETLAQARVLADWPTLVGQGIAAHSSPVSLADGELRLTAESTAWATQLRLLAPTMIIRIGDQVGPGVVRRITVSGPVAPSWQHGLRSVRGTRGPRDTYG